MEERHIPKVYTIEKECFTVPWSMESFSNEIQSNFLARYWVAIYEQTVVGYAGLWAVLDEGHITNIAVGAKWRKRGIGELLVDHLIDESQKKGVDRWTLEVRRSNLPALLLYQKKGFKIMGERQNYYTDPKEDAIIMWKLK